jgi:RNA recognition motif-containing protein
LGHVLDPMLHLTALYSSHACTFFSGKSVVSTWTQVMTDLGLPPPYALNYCFESFAFTGLAFAYFTSTEEADVVINAMNGYELEGFKLSLERKTFGSLDHYSKGQLQDGHDG